MARLEVEAGEGGDGGSFELGAEPLQVGASRRCQVCIREQGVSFVHAIISADGEGFTLLAKPSSAGTTVNGEPLRSGATRRLVPGDRLTFGKTSARFVEGPAPAPAPAPAPPPAPAPAPEPRDDADLPFHVPARLEPPPPSPPDPTPPASADDGLEALLARLAAAEGERDVQRALARELEADAEDARRALAALEARQEALQAERDVLRREVARLEAEVRLTRRAADAADGP